MRRAFLLVASLALSLALSPLAYAEESVADRCIASLDRGLALKTGGKLREARTVFVNCSSDLCPREVRDECTSHVQTLKSAIPRIVFDTKGAGGDDLSVVEVTIDGQPLVTSLTGRAIEIDPGDHEFTFTAKGAAPVTRRFVIREGDLARRETVVLGAPVAEAAATAPAAVPLRGGEGVGSKWGGTQTAGIVLLGAGAVGLAAGGGFGIVAMNDGKNERSACGGKLPNGCTTASAAQPFLTRGTTAAWVSDIAVGAGGVLAVVGAILFFKAPRAEPTGGASVSFIPEVGPGLCGVSATGGF